MKKFKVICIGYKQPSVKKLQELLEFEKDYLEREKMGSRILIHPGICLKETEIYNQNVLDKFRIQKFAEFNLGASELNTTYDFNKRLEFKILI